MLTIEIKIADELVPLVSSKWLTEEGKSDGLVRLNRPISAPTTVKDLLEALSIPHCEIGQVRANEKALHLGHLLTYAQTLTVVATVPFHLPHPRFICDQHLGALARLLRMMGFDTAWKNNWLEPEIARLAVNEGRVVLSRNRNLLKRKALNHALLIRNDQADEQAREVLGRFKLTQDIRTFGRCTKCNGPMESVLKEDVWDLIPPRTRAWLDDYWQCQDCGQLFWEGTHVETIRQRIGRLCQVK